jgi:hypothetical protein
VVGSSESEAVGLSSLVAALSLCLTVRFGSGDLDSDFKVGSCTRVILAVLQRYTQHSLVLASTACSRAVLGQDSSVLSTSLSSHLHSQIHSQHARQVKGLATSAQEQK